MTEQVCRFGPSKGLVGILTSAASVDIHRETPVVVLFNAGLLHHVGQNQLNVQLARRLSARGYSVLRFDFSGIGDSAKRRDSKSVAERTVEETRFALDYLQKRCKAECFVMMGLCSGADNAHRISVVDNRVCGVVAINGYIYPTRKYVLLRYGRRALSPKRVVDFISRRLGFMRDKKNGGSASADPDLWNFWVLPDKDTLKQELIVQIGRDMLRLAIFSGNNGAYEYRGQFADSFREIDFKDKLEEAYFSLADHNYSVLADRDDLIRLVVDWMARKFPSGM